MKHPKDHTLIPVPDHNRPGETAVQVPDQDLDHLEGDHLDDHGPGLLINEDGVHLLIGVRRHLVDSVRLQAGVVHLPAGVHLLLAVDVHHLLVGGHLPAAVHHKGVVTAMEV